MEPVKDQIDCEDLAKSEWESVLEFWFGQQGGSKEHEVGRDIIIEGPPQSHPDYRWNTKLWWGASLDADEMVRETFGNLAAEAASAALAASSEQEQSSRTADQQSAGVQPLAGLSAESSRFHTWLDDPNGCLALILLLDQFPRNLHRGKKAAFVTDHAALALTRKTLLSAPTCWYDNFAPAEKLFVLVCFEHSECIADVEEGIVLMDALYDETSKTAPLQASQLRNHLKTFRQHLDILEKFGRYPYRNAILGRGYTESERQFLAQASKMPAFARRTMKDVKKEQMSANMKKIPHKVALLNAAGIELEKYSAGAASSVAEISGNKDANINDVAKNRATKCKILMIHGFRGGAKAFRNKTGKLRSALAKAGYVLAYAEAPQCYEFKGEALNDATQDFGEVLDLSHQRVWWMADAEENKSIHQQNKLGSSEVIAPSSKFSSATKVIASAAKNETTEINIDEDEGGAHNPEAADRLALLNKKMHYNGIDRSLASLETDLERKGPFVGVMGFAQGAAMAAMLVQHLHKKRNTHGLKFAVLISGYGPRDPRFRHGFEAGALDFEKTGIATFHSWGVKDILIEPLRSEHLMDTFSFSGRGEDGDDPNAVRCPHPGAHYVPNMWPVDSIAGFAERFLPEGADDGANGNKPDGTHDDEDANEQFNKYTEERLSALLPTDLETAARKDIHATVVNLFERSRLVAEEIAQVLIPPHKRSSKIDKVTTQKIRVRPHEVADLVEALRDALGKSNNFLHRGGGGILNGFDADDIDEDIVDTTGSSRLVQFLVVLAEEALGDEPLVQLAARAKPSLGLTTAMVEELTHRNRGPEQLAALDFGLLLWLQARRIDPSADGYTSGSKALMRLVDRGGCGWSGLTRLFWLVKQIEMSVEMGGDDTKQSDNMFRIMTPSHKYWTTQALHGSSLLAEITSLWAEMLKADMERCLPSTWCDYFTGKAYSAPGDDAEPSKSRVDRAVTDARARILLSEEEKQERDISSWPSACALGVPSVGKAADKELRMAHTLAAVFPGHTGRLRELLSVLRTILTDLSPRRLEQMKSREKAERKKREREQVLGPTLPGSAYWSWRAAQPVSDAVLNPEPEPVVPSSPAELQPLYEHLATSTKPVKDIKIFTRGALVPDGRLDLCKQVVGPRGIFGLCEALATPYKYSGTSAHTSSAQGATSAQGMNFQVSTTMMEKMDLDRATAGPALSGAGILINDNIGHSVTRLLLGNNVVGNGGAKDIADLIRSGKSTITTWYIAGNRFTADGLSHIADALADDEQVDMLWLKRNPLKLGGAHLVARLLTTNRMIHTLDLDNTGLLDDGAIAVLKSLPSNGGVLKHLYLNGNGLTVKTAKVIAEVIGGVSPSDNSKSNRQSSLVQLMVGVNRLEDAGAAVIAEALKTNISLSRLGLPSNRITATGAQALADALAENTTLLSLQMGFSKATVALGELGNCIMDEGAEALGRVLKHKNSTLRELDIAQNCLTQRGVDYFLEAMREGPNYALLTLRTTSWGITRNDIAQNELEELLARNQARCTKEDLVAAAEAHMPKHVRDIFSVYRVE